MFLKRKEKLIRDVAAMVAAALARGPLIHIRIDYGCCRFCGNKIEEEDHEDCGTKK